MSTELISLATDISTDLSFTMDETAISENISEYAERCLKIVDSIQYRIFDEKNDCVSKDFEFGCHQIQNAYFQQELQNRESGVEQRDCLSSLSMRRSRLGTFRILGAVVTDKIWLKRSPFDGESDGNTPHGFGIRVQCLSDGYLKDMASIRSSYYVKGLFAVGKDCSLQHIAMCVPKTIEFQKVIDRIEEKYDIIDNAKGTLHQYLKVPKRLVESHPEKVQAVIRSSSSMLGQSRNDCIQNVRMSMIVNIDDRPDGFRITELAEKLGSTAATRYLVRTISLVDTGSIHPIADPRHDGNPNAIDGFTIDVHMTPFCMKEGKIVDRTLEDHAAFIRRNSKEVLEYVIDRIGRTRTNARINRVIRRGNVTIPVKCFSAKQYFPAGKHVFRFEFRLKDDLMAMAETN